MVWSRHGGPTSESSGLTRLLPVTAFKLPVVTDRVHSHPSYTLLLTNIPVNHLTKNARSAKEKKNTRADHRRFVTSPDPPCTTPTPHSHHRQLRRLFLSAAGWLYPTVTKYILDPRTFPQPWIWLSVSRANGLGGACSPCLPYENLRTDLCS